MLVYIEDELDKFISKYFSGSDKTGKIKTYYWEILDQSNSFNYAANKTLERFKSERVLAGLRGLRGSGILNTTAIITK